MAKNKGKTSLTAQRRKERQRQKARQRQIYIAVGLVAVAVIALALIIVANQPADAPVPDDRYEGIAQTINIDGFPMLGDPEAPVRVAEYSSFDCPACQGFHEEVMPVILERIEAGDINFTYVPLYGTGGISNGLGAAQAAVCAMRQNSFWVFHDTLFDWQSQYGNSAFSNNRLLSGVNNLGLSEGDFTTCFDSQATVDVLNAAISAANALGEGFTGTPTITVNGTIVTATIPAITEAIDSALVLAGGGTGDEPVDVEVTPEPEPTDEVGDEADVESAEDTPEPETSDEGDDMAGAEDTPEPETTDEGDDMGDAEDTPEPETDDE